MSGCDPAASKADGGPALRGVRAIALIEGAKGALVLLAGLGFLGLVRRDVQAVAERVVRLLHFDPASRYPRILLDAAARVTDTHLWLLASAAVLYAAIRAVEAYGLWHARRWAEGFALGSASLYLPVEIYHLLRRLTWVGFGVFAVNLAIVAYLSFALWRRARQDRPGA